MQEVCVRQAGYNHLDMPGCCALILLRRCGRWRIQCSQSAHRAAAQVLDKPLAVLLVVAVVDYLSEHCAPPVETHRVRPACKCMCIYADFYAILLSWVPHMGPMFSSSSSGCNCSCRGAQCRSKRFSFVAICKQKERRPFFWLGPVGNAIRVCRSSSG